MWRALVSISIVISTVLCLPCSAQPRSRPLLDIVDIQSLRDNPLVGYGLVVGLSGTGDRNQVKFTSQSMTSMLKQFGVKLPENIDPKLKNVAAVSIHTHLSSLAGVGQRIDVTVSSIGDAKSLRGGSLLMTPLRGLDGNIYAVAQGNLVIGGASAQGESGSSVTINTPTAGIIPGGAIIEKAIPSFFTSKSQLTLNLIKPNFRTARNIEREINKIFGPEVALAQTPGRIQVSVPTDARQRMTFMSMLEDVNIQPGRERAKVVFNSRTGTIVLGANVRVKTAAVAHGNLTVIILEGKRVSQPAPFSNGSTVVTPDSDVRVEQEENKMSVWPEGTSLSVIVKAVNSLGASPDDLMSILQALNEVGALEAELVVI
jgi:flagellar P-ring protein FlgI